MECRGRSDAARVSSTTRGAKCKCCEGSPAKKGKMNERAYLDWNATAPLLPPARAAMIDALDVVGNPSSVHGEGRAARRLVEQAREEVASLVGAEPRNVLFTSGGTEANALALTPAIEIVDEKAPRDRLLI